MSDYIRTTRECAVSELHPELLLGLQDYFQGHRLGNLQSDITICCETVSRKKNAGKTLPWLDGRPDSIIHMGMLLTSKWLIWAHHGDQTGTRVNSASLNEIHVDFYTPLFSTDSGLRIVGFVGDDNTRIRGYLGMGKEPASQKFCEEVQQAIVKANPSTQRDIFKWFGR